MPPIAPAVAAPTAPAAPAAPAAPVAVRCGLDAFLQSFELIAFLCRSCEFLEIGKDRPPRRIGRRNARQHLGLGRQNDRKRARSCNAEQTLEKHSSIHASLLQAK